MSDLNSTLAPIAAQFESQMRKIAESGDHSEDYKAREIERLRSEGLSKVGEVVTAYLEKIKAEKQQLVEKTRLPSPSPEFAAQLTYTKEALVSKWQTMTPAQIISDFAAAIESKDVVAVRVYYEFGTNGIVKNLQARSGQSDVPVPFEFRELLTSAEAVIFDRRVLFDKKRLAQIDDELARRKRGVDPAATALLKNLTYRAGKLHDKRVEALQRATGF